MPLWPSLLATLQAYHLEDVLARRSIPWTAIDCGCWTLGHDLWWTCALARVQLDAKSFSSQIWVPGSKCESASHPFYPTCGSEPFGRHELDFSNQSAHNGHDKDPSNPLTKLCSCRGTHVSGCRRTFFLHQEDARLAKQQSASYREHWALFSHWKEQEDQHAMPEHGSCTWCFPNKITSASHP